MMSVVAVMNRILLACILCAVSTTGHYVLRTFSDSTNKGNFNHLVVDKTSGKLYLGAVNRLYQLTPTLSKDSSIETGPKLDNPDCPPTGDCDCLDEHCHGSLTRKETDSINKALVIDYKTKKLIVCSSLFQGHCEKRKLSDLTEVDTPIYEPMVPNDLQSSVYMFIGPGPSDSAVLYIGATRSLVGLDALRDLVPTVCSRNIASFKLARKFIYGSTKKEIESTLRKSFLVKYVYGFSSGLFSYFLTVQKESTSTMTNNKYVSRLVRVCHNDEKFFSYTEIPFQCHYNGSKFNILQAAVIGKAAQKLAVSLGIPTTEDVLFALFSKSVPGSDEPINQSALCIYSMRSIVTKFTVNIQKCFSGYGNTGPAHITNPISCGSTKFQIDDNYCGNYDVNQPIAGTIPVIQDAVLHMESKVTSIAVTTTHHFTVAFIGTNTGTIKKVFIESKKKASVFEEVSIEPGKPILSDLNFDREDNTLYVLTQKKVTQMSVHNCSQYVNCSECLSAKDPFCGWCDLENKCSVKADCNNAAARWLPFDGKQCPRIKAVHPREVQISSQPTRLRLEMYNLPSLSNGNYQCAFKGYDHQTHSTTATKVGNNSIECETLYFNLLPAIPTGIDHIVMKLSVRLNDKDFVSTNFTFFKCETHTSCTRCTKSAFPCTWCVRKHACTYNRDECGTDILITGQNLPGNTDRPGPQKCPRIEYGFTEILVPSGIMKQVSVKALNLQPFQNNFQCTFNIDGGKTVSGKKVGEDRIECDPLKFQYSSHSVDLNVPFLISWGARKYLDNPTDIQVKVYKCSVMADNCGMCLTLNSKYRCGWCAKRCATDKECLPSNVWLDRSSICPNPQILNFYPTSGPVDGGTSVTIEGINLGKVFDDIKDGVVVAGVPCNAIKESYVAAKRVVCVTGSIQQARPGQITIMVQNRHQGKSNAVFQYVKSEITNIKPTLGPQSGGTLLTIFGTYMNAGTNITARAAGLPCHLVETKENAVVCVTTKSDSRKNGIIEMTFDRARTTYTGRYFKYVADPTITKVEPQKSILSGGNLVVVEGEGLDSIADPKMSVTVAGNKYESDCVVFSSTSMQCYSPNIIKSGIQIESEEPLKVVLGFIMDEVTELRNLSGHYPFSNFMYVPNPEFEEFKDGIKYFQQKSEYLTINGKNLNLALRKEDVRVMIGTRHCNVTSIAPTQLTCKPPNPPYNSDSSKVMVTAGRNLTFAIGHLHYEGPEGSSDLQIIIGVGIAAPLIVFLFIFFFVAYCVKSRESDREMKRMRTQMDILESRVAKECKEAFAELQTDMTEITSDLDGIGIPFREYRSFSMHVLFPNINEDQHPVTRSLEVEICKRDSMERGLRLFNQLISSKTFLLLLIRTLESNEDFSMRERVNVASLISVALQDRMEYYTDILKTLLSDLIEKAMDRQNHPKLLLRRTESVAEKMLTNWFTFLLYKFLKECAGEPLFMLFRAIKQQVEKGPIDSVTSEAKYSLSEDKLIRQQIDYNTLTIYALDPENQYGTKDHPVKVLDCDTISQCKDKILDAIYKNQPFSNRPDKDDLELEWRTGLTGRIVLQDEDVTTKSDGDYKRINTLLHYKVADGSVMALVPRQSSHYNLSLHSDRSGSGPHKFNPYGTNQSLGAYSAYMTGSPALSRSVSPNNINIDMDNVKFYHLVKPHDSDTQKEGDRGSKMVSEIYLTRLLSTKGTLQQFVDDLFETLFSTAHRGSALPLAIKYMFDFLDDQALQHGQDAEVVHTWKSNSLPLRFWVNMMKNPDFVFDINKSHIVDSCLSVVAQTFMDSCSMSDHRLGKDSPSSKLLYAKDIPKYKKWVERYYQDIKMMPAISDQDMNATLAEESRHHQNEFNLNAALNELYKYVVRYNDKLLDALDEDEFARKNRLTYKLEQVHNCMESEA